jgi:membrane protein YqaA with SNARE-associated domain
MSALRRAYDRMLTAARGPNAEPALAVVSFAESSFFPIPPDIMLIPMMIARPDRIWRLAAICTIASVVGGLFGYLIGYALYATVGQWLITVYGLGEDMAAYTDAFDTWGFAIIVAKGMTPIPYKLVTIASGVARMDIALFILASIIARGMRFFLVGLLIRLFGAPIQAFIEKYLTLCFLGFLALIVLGFVAIEYF